MHLHHQLPTSHLPLPLKFLQIVLITLFITQRRKRCPQNKEVREKSRFPSLYKENALSADGKQWAKVWLWCCLLGLVAHPASSGTSCLLRHITEHGVWVGCLHEGQEPLLPCILPLADIKTDCMEYPYLFVDSFLACSPLVHIATLRQLSLDAQWKQGTRKSVKTELSPFKAG